MYGVVDGDGVEKDIIGIWYGEGDGDLGGKGAVGENLLERGYREGIGRWRGIWLVREV